ncbi:hypothetical protein RN001_005807 [Aquatica leii]|uniref:Regulatory protein zeste n=1 Tax=Aquatica leii TaxID=1421715 RepID=A0AAN7PD76_9COLE|nr:hypothetical protein RN001_005807 [Aquatica leii]
MEAGEFVEASTSAGLSNASKHLSEHEKAAVDGLLQLFLLPPTQQHRATQVTSGDIIIPFVRGNYTNNNKLDRSSNWSEEEKLLLVNLITPHKKKLENKQKLLSTNKQKEECWKKISDSFAPEGYSRTVARLKEQWRRIKMQSKKNFATDRKNLKLTGSGPPPKTETTKLHEIVSGLGPYILIEDTAEFDCDAFNEINTNKKKNKMTAYEREMLKLNKQKIELSMKHMEEQHHLATMQSKELHELKIQNEK